MKMIWVLLQSESVQPAVDALRKTGIHSMTRMNLTGDKNEPRISSGWILDAGLYREILMIVLADNDVAKAVIAIRTAVKTSRKMFQNSEISTHGKIFVSYIENFYTIGAPARRRSGFKTYDDDYCSDKE